MKDERKTKGQLVNELVELRQRIAELEASETEHRRVEEALREDKPPLLGGIALEVTEQVRAEEELHRVNWALRLLSRCNQAVIRATEESSLLHEICQLIVEAGGYRLAWIGFAEQNEEKTVRPVAQAGFEEGYLDTVNITWADTERGRGPTGTAIRAGEPSICRNMLTDPKYAPWREEATQRGYASSMALPLLANGQTLGALNIYAVEPAAFDTQEVELLTELANDLAYGIVALRTRTERKRAEEALRQERDRAQKYLDIAGVVIVAINAKGEVTLINRKGSEILGYEQEEIISKNWFDNFLPVSIMKEEVRTVFHRLMASEIEPVEYYENPVLIKGGEERIIAWHNAILKDDEGNIIGTLSSGEDITERKRAEEALRESEKRFRDLYENAPNAYFSVGVAGRIRRCNRRAGELLGYAVEELVGRPVLELYADTPQGKAKASKVLERFQAGETVRDEELQMQKADGTPVWISLTVNALRDAQGRIVESRSMVVDITERIRAEQGLRERDELLTEMSRIAKIGAWEFDAVTLEGTWTDETARIHDLDPAGETNVELGLSFYQGESRWKIESAVRQAIEQGKPYDLELELVTAKGSHKWVRTIGHPVRQGDRVVRVRGTFQDITERKQAEEAIQQQSKDLATLLEVSQTLAATLDLETVLQTTTDGVTELMGLKSAAVYLLEGEWLYLWATTPPLDPQMPETFRRAPLADHPHIWEAVSTGLPVLLPDTATADLTPAERTISEARGLRTILYLPLLVGAQVTGTLIVATAGEPQVISKTKIDLCSTLANLAALAVENARLYASVQRHAAELEQRVAKRTAELEIALDKAQEADRVKSAFLATMSHELRTPLNSIIGFTGILLQGLAGPLNPEQEKQLGMTYDSAKHLLALINDVLDISKIEAGQLEIAHEPFDMCQAIEKAVRTVSPQAEKKGLTLVAEVAPGVGQFVSDRRRVEQILINLLNNAIKFTEQGEVRLVCQVSDGWLVMRVMDTGIGIRPEDMDKLFKSFQQAETGLPRMHEGTGLGLSICKKLVEMLGGEIWAESEWGVGSTFTFTIPIDDL
jgi:PAS domain S-box-containing protein